MMVCCTELYLDERAFMEHAGSRDYLAAYGKVMTPGLQARPATTVCLGTPPAPVVEKILDPILRAKPEPMVDGCFLWRRPKTAAKDGSAVFISLDVASADPAMVAREAFPAALIEECTTFVAFQHPLRPDTVRILLVIPALTPQALSGLALVRAVRGEAHTSEANADQVKAAFTGVGLGHSIVVNQTEAVGYILHEKATEIHSI
jgi:hypothetical protein